MNHQFAQPYHLVHGQGLHFPIETVKFQPVELAGFGSDRVSQRPFLKEARSCFEGAENRRSGNIVGQMPVHQQMCLPVIAIHGNAVAVALLVNLENGMVLHAGKQPAAQ